MRTIRPIITFLGSWTDSNELPRQGRFQRRNRLHLSAMTSKRLVPRFVIIVVFSVLLAIGILCCSTIIRLWNDRGPVKPIHVLIYETESLSESPSFNLKNQALRLRGVMSTIFGVGLDFDGCILVFLRGFPRRAARGRRILFARQAQTSQGVC